MASKSTPPTKSGSAQDIPPDKLSATAWAVLKHVSLYHLTFAEPLQELFFPEGKDRDGMGIGSTLDLLTRCGYLKNTDVIDEGNQDDGNQNDREEPRRLRVGGTKYYLLGGRAIAQCGFDVPKERKDPTKSLQPHLGTLWYCVMDGTRRYRLDQQELEHFFPPTEYDDGVTRRIVYDQNAYCLSDEEQGPTIYRIYIPREPKDKQDRKRGNDRTVLRAVTTMLEQDLARPILPDWITSRQYGYAILMPSEAKRQNIEKLVRTSQGGSRPILDRVRISVHFAPQPAYLGRALRKRHLT